MRTVSMFVLFKKQMSLYYEAASFIEPSAPQTNSLKSRIYNAKNLKSTPAQIFALVSEASKWSLILKEVVEKSQLLLHELKVSQIIFKICNNTD